jgi:AcrR family transcriptional regulator
MSVYKTLSARERILNTAHTLFYREGIRATGVDRLIAEAGVTKVTFYRHFPSKTNLILAYLQYRHQLWMTWLRKAIVRRRGYPLDELLVSTFREWVGSEEYRGCAFINAVVELQGDLPEVGGIAKRHKDELVETIADLMPETEDRMAIARAVVVALDGAIVHAQIENHPDFAIDALETVLRKLLR